MKFAAIAAALAAAASLSACVVAPVGPVHGAALYAAPIEPPVGVAIVGPTYVSPGPGWGWRYHPRYGWGWYNPHAGWHRGWR